MAKKKKRLSRKEREQKKQLRNQRLIALVLTVLMIGSLAGVATFGGNSGSETMVGNYSANIESNPNFYVPSQSVRTLVIEVPSDQTVYFYSEPQYVSSFLDNDTSLNFLSKAESIVFSKTSNNNSQQEAQLLDLLRLNLNQQSSSTIITPEQAPNINNTSLLTTNNRTEVLCADSSKKQPVILIEFAEDISVDENEGCILIHTRPEQTHIVRDLLLYSAHNIPLN
ncbi:MAG: hypothetical protein ACQESC_03305 [Nanobdellota archaeon]